mmetsp:Transcript_11124/g.51572  ORF Transcript_11124/g.51572 Transcript_11124/m.51572 type:complete len:460 (-) Transcript_11124:3826-5205(-)
MVSGAGASSFVGTAVSAPSAPSALAFALVDVFVDVASEARLVRSAIAAMIRLARPRRFFSDALKPFELADDRVEDRPPVVMPPWLDRSVDGSLERIGPSVVVHVSGAFGSVASTFTAVSSTVSSTSSAVSWSSTSTCVTAASMLARTAFAVASSSSQVVTAGVVDCSFSSFSPLASMPSPPSSSSSSSSSSSEGMSSGSGGQVASGSNFVSLSASAFSPDEVTAASTGVSRVRSTGDVLRRGSDARSSSTLLRTTFSSSSELELNARIAGEEPFAKPAAAVARFASSRSTASIAETMSPTGSLRPSSSSSSSSSGWSSGTPLGSMSSCSGRGSRARRRNRPEKLSRSALFSFCFPSGSVASSSECLPISALLSVLHVAVSVSIVRPIGFRFGFLRSPSGTSASSVRVNTRRVSSSIRQVSSPNGIERSRQSCPTEGSIGSITCSVSTASFFRTFLAGLD